MEGTFNFIQCCESGMIYSGTGYDILEFRFLPMVLSIFGNYKKYLITNQTEESTKYLSFFYYTENTYLKPNTLFLLHLNFDGGKHTFSLPFPHFCLGICPGTWLIDLDLLKPSVALIWTNLEHMSWIKAINFLDIFRRTENTFLNHRVGEKSFFLTQFVLSSHRDLLYSRALLRKIFPEFPSKNFVDFLSSLHVFEAAFSLASKICFICR